jgi:hypothetical protein
MALTLHGVKELIKYVLMYHHHPINVPAAGAQAFLLNIRRTGHNPPRGPTAGW